MKTHCYIPVRAFRFRRYCRAAYAAFRSMHRVVTIGHVAAYIADRQLRKSVTAAAVVVALLPAANAVAQSDDDLEGLTLPVVTITAAGDSAAASEGAAAAFSHQDIQHLTAATVGELLEALPGVDLRSRGTGDMQGDIVLRGGTFDQVVVLLNGINIADPQTGHHNLDLPIDLSLVERVEVLPPAALLRYGVAAFCGGINIVTSQASGDRLRIAARGGSHGTAGISAGGGRRVGEWTLAAHGAYDRSDGYRRNTDYRHALLFVQARRGTASQGWHLQAGAQGKDFGSEAFYSLRYPDQFEATRTLWGSAAYGWRMGRWQCDATAYGRLHGDRFELFREGFADPPAWYGGHNHHLSSVAGARLRGYRWSAWGRTTVGVDYRREGIVSNVLGDSLAAPVCVLGQPYALGKVRHRATAFAEQSIRLEHWQLSAAVLAHATHQSGAASGAFSRAALGYALSAQWRPADSLTLAASLSRSDRQPTFTDLYYHSATQLANPLLQSEICHAAELSACYRWHRAAVSATLYGRRGSNIIDWIRQPDETVWHSVNHTQVNALGGDVRLSWRVADWLPMADLRYAYCTLSRQADGYVSQYALDYLRHALSASLSFRPFPQWFLKASADYHYRIGGYTALDGIIRPYEPVFLLHASAGRCWQHLTLSLEAHNLLNRNYMDYGGIPQPGTTLMLSAGYEM